MNKRIKEINQNAGVFGIKPLCGNLRGVEQIQRLLDRMQRNAFFGKHRQKVKKSDVKS